MSQLIVIDDINMATVLKYKISHTLTLHKQTLLLFSHLFSETSRVWEFIVAASHARSNTEGASI